MKKIILILLTAFVMCVGLCACGADMTDEQTAAVCGTWYLRAYEEKAENPGYLELKKDGTGTLDGSEPLTWTGSGSEAGVTVTVVTESEAEYTLALAVDKTEAWLSMDKDGPDYCYHRADTAVATSWFGELLTLWHARDVKTAVQTLALNKNGTLRMNDAVCFWSSSDDWVDDEDSVHLYLYDAQGVFGVLEAYSTGNGLYDFIFYDYATLRGYSYTNHPVVNYLDIGSWESFDRHTMIDDFVILGAGNRTAEIAGVEYSVRFDTAADPTTVSVSFLEGEEVRYSALIFMDGEYPMVTLTDPQTGRQTLYYNSEYGYADENPDARYYGTLDLLYRYAGGGSLYLPETGELLEPEVALRYCYEQLTALGDYRQTKDFLARFTILPNKLTSVTQYCTDYQGDVHEIYLNRYGYNKNGVLIWGQGEEIIEKFGVDSTAVQHFTYDRKGKLTGVTTDDGHTQGMPIFDTAGKLVGMHVEGEDVEYTTVYTYGEGHRVIRMGVSRSESYYPLVYEYEYDGEGRLVTKTVDRGNSFAATTTYTYEDGTMVESSQVFWRGGWPYSNNWSFTYDEQGRPMTARVATDDPDMDYADIEVRYIYKDLYFFDTAGLLQ